MPADVVSFLLIAVSTFVSEDLTCIAAGMAASAGKISFQAAVLACASGIFAGDLLLFAAGRFAGRPAVARVPFRWFISARQLDDASRWFAEKGQMLILTSRFVPGMRLPTYFAAGVLKTRLRDFLFWFALAALIWTPLIVLAAYVLGENARRQFAENHLLAGMAALAVSLYLFVRLLLTLSTFRGRRRLAGALVRLRWEFWPSWAVYPPIVLYCIYQTLRWRSPLLFTACNPGIEGSGVVGESKARILERLPADSVARFRFLPGSWSHAEKLKSAQAFAKTLPDRFPLVVKPDQGQRGSGVRIVRNSDQLSSALNTDRSLVLQQYIPGKEFGIFYARHPQEEHGRIISVTRKIMPVVIGDGHSSIEELILKDRRAVALAIHYLTVNADRKGEIPKMGEKLALVELGTHARGAVFLNGADLITPALDKEIDRISKGFPGFHLGRYDIRVPDETSLKRGKDLRVIELNGVTSEPTHIYDPSVSIVSAYRAMLMQWRLAYEYGAANVRLGHAPMTVLGILRLMRQFMNDEEVEWTSVESRESRAQERDPSQQGQTEARRRRARPR